MDSPNADPALLTEGLREAYKHGLALALPTARNELGFAMVERDKRSINVDSHG